MHCPWSPTTIFYMLVPEPPSFIVRFIIFQKEPPFFKWWLTSRAVFSWEPEPFCKLTVFLTIIHRSVRPSLPIVVAHRFPRQMDEHRLGVKWDRTPKNLAKKISTSPIEIMCSNVYIYQVIQFDSIPDLSPIVGLVTFPTFDWLISGHVTPPYQKRSRDSTRIASWMIRFHIFINWKCLEISIHSLRTGSFLGSLPRRFSRNRTWSHDDQILGPFRGIFSGSSR